MFAISLSQSRAPYPAVVLPLLHPIDRLHSMDGDRMIIQRNRSRPVPIVWKEVGKVFYSKEQIEQFYQIASKFSNGFISCKLVKNSNVRRPFHVPICKVYKIHDSKFCHIILSKERVMRTSSK